MTKEPSVLERAEWASVEDWAAWRDQLMLYGSGYSQVGSDGLRRFIDINDFRLKPPEEEPPPNTIKSPWLP